MPIGHYLTDHIAEGWAEEDGPLYAALKTTGGQHTMMSIDSKNKVEQELWVSIISSKECEELWNVNRQRTQQILSSLHTKYGDAVVRKVGGAWIITRANAEKYRPGQVGNRGLNIATMPGTEVS